MPSRLSGVCCPSIFPTLSRWAGRSAYLVLLVIFSTLLLFTSQAKEALSFLTVGADVLDRVEATFVEIKVAVFAVVALESADAPQQAFALFAFRFHGVLIRSQ